MKGGGLGRLFLMLDPRHINILLKNPATFLIYANQFVLHKSTPLFKVSALIYTLDDNISFEVIYNISEKHFLCDLLEGFLMSVGLCGDKINHTDALKGCVYYVCL